MSTNNEPDRTPDEPEGPSLVPPPDLLEKNIRESGQPAHQKRVPPPTRSRK